MSFLPEVREMTRFFRLELVSQVPVECWLLSNLQKSYSLIWAHFWKYGLLFGVQGIGVSFRPGLHCCWVKHEVVSHLAIKTGPCASTRELQGHLFLLRFLRLLLNVWKVLFPFPWWCFLLTCFDSSYLWFFPPIFVRCGVANSEVE